MKGEAAGVAVAGLTQGTRAAMRHKAAKPAKTGGAQSAPPDPRLAAIARLLARDLARRHFQQALDEGAEPAYPAPSQDSDDPRNAS